MNLMLVGVATRNIGRAVRLPEGRLRQIDGDGTSKSAASRRFVALSQERMEAWLSSDLSKLDLLVIQIDGLHVAEDIVLVGAIGIDASGEKHILGLVEGATENAAVLTARCLTRSVAPAQDSAEIPRSAVRAVGTRGRRAFVRCGWRGLGDGNARASKREGNGETSLRRAGASRRYSTLKAGRNKLHDLAAT